MEGITVDESVLGGVALSSAVEEPLHIAGSHGDTDLSDVGTEEKTTLCAEEDPHGVEMSEGTENEVISLLLPDHQTEVPDEEAPNLDLPDGSMLGQGQDGPLQAVMLADGTTAYIQHKKGASKFLEGQAVTLEDGTTAIVQPSSPLKETAVHQESGAKFEDGQAVQLEDGTTAFIHNTHKGVGYQAIQLEDGTTAYLAPDVAESLFVEQNNLDSASIPLDQLTAQASEGGETSQANPTSLVEQSRTATLTVMSAPTTSNSGGILLSVDKPVMSEKAFKCDFEGCEKLYTSQHHLKVHSRSHTGDRPFKCEYPGCTKAFATGYGMKSHNRVHTGEKPYKCTVEPSCSKAFKTSGDLQKHIRTHTGERPFKCPFEGCDRSFTTSNIRKVHIRTHTGERPYVCNQCGRAFASATNYKNHIRIHTGEKPYVCTVANCGKRFTEYSSLYKHHVVHTHAKPYECNHCNRNYRQTSTLAMHKRTVHNEEMTPEAEAELFAQNANDCDMSDLKRARLELTTANDANLGDTATVQVGDQESSLVINTGEAGEEANEAAHVTLQQIQQQGLASVTIGNGGQIFVVTDPSQLEALQQLAAQQLELQPASGVDGIGAIDIIAEAPTSGSIVVSADNSALSQRTEFSEIKF